MRGPRPAEAEMSQASAGDSRLGPASIGSQPTGPRASFEQPMHKIWGRLEEVSVGDGSSGSSEKLQQLAMSLEGVQVEDSWESNNNSNSGGNSWERAAGAAGGARARPGPSFAVAVAAVQDHFRGSLGSAAPAGGAPDAAPEAGGKVSRQTRALSLFGPMSARGGAREDPPMPCYDQMLHDSGQCRPCNYFVKKGGCGEKDACQFCHLEHETPRRLRPCKVKRERCKHMVESLASRDLEVVERMGEISERSSLQGSYMRTIMATQAKTTQADGTDIQGDSQPSIAI